MFYSIGIKNVVTQMFKLHRNLRYVINQVWCPQPVHEIIPRITQPLGWVGDVLRICSNLNCPC